MNKFTIKFGLASILASALFISSCSKDNNAAVIPEGTTVRLNIGQAYAPNNGVAKAASVGRSYASTTQTVEIPFNNEYTIVASLTAEEAVAPSLKASNRAATTSTGSEQHKLNQGTIYYVAIFDAAGDYKETKSFTQGNGAQNFAIEKGKYTFVIYASGSNKTLPSIAAGAKLSAVNFEGLTADQDFMVDQVPFEVKDGQNILNADLAHLFTQVTLKFDASAIGAVSSIAGATIEPSNAAADVNLANGTLTYKGNVSPVAFNLKNTTGTVINSDSTFITTAATTSGKISLQGVSIGGSTAKPIASSNWSLKPGVKYILEFKLKKPTDVNIGGSTWGLGNLVYNSTTGKYGFAEANNAAGDYFFADYVLPKFIPTSDTKDPWIYHTPSRERNGAAGDPCKLVDGNNWRLPTEQEANALVQRTNPNSADNPRSDAAARWVDTFSGNVGGKLGMFFGVYSHPGAARDRYLFMLFAGQYSSSNALNGSNDKAYYLIKATSEGYKKFEMGGGKGNIGWDCKVSEINSDDAVQVRCVRN